MNVRSMLNAFAQLLETHTMGDDAKNDSEVCVASINMVCDYIMHISIEANDGTRRQFHLVEV